MIQWRHEGRCNTCGKSFQQKMFFQGKEKKETIAVTCSWCKESYHLKNCFPRDKLDERLVERSCAKSLRTKFTRHISKSRTGTKKKLNKYFIRILLNRFFPFSWDAATSLSDDLAKSLRESIRHRTQVFVRHFALSLKLCVDQSFNRRMGLCKYLVWQTFQMEFAGGFRSGEETGRSSA
jgi:hypothetical protein